MTTVENGAGDAASKDKTVEDRYKKTSPLEHVLMRPDIYIDSVEPTTELMWIYDKEKQMMIQREVNYVPGLFKIFDEILVNAADNKQRDPKMDMIKIEIDEKNNQISVWNNGEGIPVVIHKKENMYVPTMIFGHLLTSSNYDDTQARVTGGRNGLGAKLCNIFSHRFTVETASKKYKKRLKQTWGNNMKKTSEPVISDFKGEDFTRVTFSPDLEKFHMQSLDQDIVDLMSRRALDVAASTRGVKVVLNGEKLPIRNFRDYINLYTKGKEDDGENPLTVVYESCGPRWEVAVTLSTKGFQHVSFVNSIATTKGGRHIDHVADLITKQLMETLKKKNKTGIQMKPAQIKNHLWIFVNCLIDNPSFNTQTKEHMTLQQKNFGSKCVLSEKFIASMTKAGFVEAILSWANRKADDQLQKLGSKTKRRKLHVDKLEDANDAGTAKSVDCTLILTEGDSAKTMAVSGISNIGRDKYGIFPLRGKILNVRDATRKQILENAEINKLLNIIGLRYGKKYETREDLKTLRYGKMMIMTDQDQDGSHIKGLLINFIHHNWPSLLKLDFIEEFITPIVKATKGSQQLSFFSLPEFESWKKETSNFHTYKIKYYKGLGTSTAKEAKEYFDNMARHRIRFKYEGGQDDENIKMAFSKNCVSQRKDWLTNHMEETKRRKEIGLGEKYLYEKNTRTVSYSDFINAELVLFSNYDNVRSIPNMIDGFKPGQRKVLYTCMKRNDKNEVKVAQLAGSVAEHSAYHHGEQSLMATIINLAQNFVGSNNINLLQPIGQFGSRLMGGKDSASPRYIFTMLSPLTRIIFNKFDDALLTYEFDDNRKIEPVYYVPIIPMVLVNGAEGIGTGWSTKILNYNPREIIENLCRMMDGEDPKPMIPYYKNFKGVVESCGDYQYVFSGEISVIGADKVEITELPIGKWTQAYKDTVLEPMMNGTEKQPAVITDYKEYNTDTEVRFLVFLNRDKLVELERDGLHEAFKLQRAITSNSKCAFDENLCLRKFDNVLEILRGFYKVRLEFYLKRKNYMEGFLDAEMKKLLNQARFISEICEGSLVVHDKKKKGLIAELVKRKYDSDPLIAWKLRQNREEVLQEVAENLNEEAETTPGENFEYLYGMNILTLTEDRRDELLRQRDDKIAELKRLQSRTPISLWKEDLDTLLAELNKVEEKERKEEQKSKHASKKPPQKLYKTDDKRRIVPIIDTEMKKKAEKYDKEKKEGTKKQAKQVKKEPKEEKDEFDALVESNVKPLDDRIGNSPDKIEKKAATKKGMKQTTLPFKTSKKEKKKHKDSEDSEDEIDFDSISPVTTPRTPRRAAAAAKKNYNLSSDESESDTGHIDLDSDVEVSKPKTTKRMAAIDSDSDDAFKIDKKAPPPKVSSEELFDSLIGSSTTPKETNKSLEIPSSDDSPIRPPPKKVTARKKPENGGAKGPKKGARKPKKKRSKTSDSDSDEMFSAKESNAKRHKKDSDTSNDVDSDDVVDATPPPRATAGRARKPVSYAIKSDDESD